MIFSENVTFRDFLILDSYQCFTGILWKKSKWITMKFKEPETSKVLMEI